MTGRRKRKRGNSPRLSLFFKVCAAAVCLGAMFFAAKSALVIDTVVIEGANAVSRQSVLKRIGMPHEGGTFLLMPGSVSGALEKAPWIKEASARRNFSGKVAISIKEKIPFCLYAADDGKLYYLDDSGARLGAAPAGNYGMDYPVLRSPMGFVSGGIEVLKLSLSSVAAPGWDDISEVSVPGEEGVDIFTRQGAVIEMGADLKGLWEKLEKITRNLYASGRKAKYINLRREGVGILRLNGG